MLKDLTLPKPIPPEMTIQERLIAMYEKAAPTAFTVLFSLLMSPKQEIQFNAAKEILSKVVPEKRDDNFAFLVKKSEEELIALIAGSGAFEQLKGLISATNQGHVSQPAESRVGEPSPIDVTAERVPTDA